MKEKIKNSLPVKIFVGITIVVISSLLISIFIMVAGMRDSVMFVIPYVDSLQNKNIKILNDKYVDVVKLVKEKNSNSQSRINSISDGWKIIESKVDTLIEGQKKSDRRQNTFEKRQIFMFKKVKELKPYSDFIVEKVDTIK